MSGLFDVVKDKNGVLKNGTFSEVLTLMCNNDLFKSQAEVITKDYFEQQNSKELKMVFRNGVSYIANSFQEIRNRAKLMLSL